MNDWQECTNYPLLIHEGATWNIEGVPYVYTGPTGGILVHSYEEVKRCLVGIHLRPVSGCARTLVSSASQPQQKELITIACRNHHEWLSEVDHTSNPGGSVPASPHCGRCGRVYLYEVKRDSTARERELFDDVLRELLRARAEHPVPNAPLGALMEEVGEVAKAVMYEPWRNVRTESVQAIAMLVRLVLEGDCTWEEWRTLHVHGNGRWFMEAGCVMPDQKRSLHDNRDSGK